MTFILDAASLSAWQACRRRFLLNSEWHPRKWRPRSLLSSCLRDAIFSISNGADPRDAAKDARIKFMEISTSPGLDMPGGDTYQLAKDCCAVIDVIPRCVAKLILLTLQPAPDLELDIGTHWHPLAWADDSGALHRWIFTDRTDADRMLAETHSWYVAGDVMLARVPMTLHFVEIGQIRKGRLRSPWTQAYRLPALRNGDYHFRAKSGAALKGQWETIHLADDVHCDRDDWAERCWTEGAAQSWIQHVNVKVSDEEACAATTEMIRDEARAMKQALEGQWHQHPMARAMCDGPFLPCVFQPVCYSPTLVQIEKLSLYIPRSTTYDTLQEAMPDAPSTQLIR